MVPKRIDLQINILFIFCYSSFLLFFMSHISILTSASILLFLGRCCWLNNLCCYCYLHLMGLVFWNSIHLEVASDSFSFLINSSWLLVFMISWKGIYFSYNLLHIGLIFSFHYWFRDLLREFDKKYEVLLIIFFLVFLLFLVSEGLLFVSFFWTSFHSLSSPTLGSWPQQGFYLPDPCEFYQPMSFAWQLHPKTRKQGKGMLEVP